MDDRVMMDGYSTGEAPFEPLRKRPKAQAVRETLRRWQDAQFELRSPKAGRQACNRSWPATVQRLSRRRSSSGYGVRA